STFYENGEHDYVAFREDSRYTIARPMCTLLKDSGLVEDWDSIRRIPKTNVLFHRSRNFKELADPIGAEALARGFVDEILEEIAGEEGFEVGERVEAREQLVVDEDGRHAEDAGIDRVAGRGAQAILRRLRRRGGDQCVTVQAAAARDGGHARRIRHTAAAGPG